jgi:hypothetical protein
VWNCPVMPYPFMAFSRTTLPLPFTHIPNCTVSQPRTPQHKHRTLWICHILYYESKYMYLLHSFQLQRTKLAHVNLIVWQNLGGEITHICICGSNRHNQLLINFTLHAWFISL